MSRKLVVFDFDSTLADTQPQLDIALAEFSTMKGLSHDAKKMAVGYVDPLKYDLGWGVSLEDQPQLLLDLNEYYTQQMIEHQRFMPELYPSIRESIDEMVETYDLGIVTARIRVTLNEILKHSAMNHHFPSVRTFCCARERG